jgi:hypothetical protein
MSSKFSRFLHLERSRGERTAPTEPTQLQNGNRFEGVAGPREAPQSASVPEAHLERFKGEAPLGLVDPVQKAEYFPRCGSCLAENGAFAKECGQCGADLTTPQQRAYNEQLRQSRQQEEARVREEIAALEQERKRLEAERQQDAERYAQLLKQTLKQEQAGARWQAMAQHGSIGLWLLSLIPHPGVRWGVLTAAILMPLLLWRFGRGTTRFVAAVLGFLLLVLLLPHRRRW